jgi:hypothetical protein
LQKPAIKGREKRKEKKKVSKRFSFLFFSFPPKIKIPKASFPPPKGKKKKIWIGG